jgi:hypothetical protein
MVHEKEAGSLFDMKVGEDEFCVWRMSLLLAGIGGDDGGVRA